MNKQQQIEEIKKVIISVYGRMRTGGENFLNNRQAEALYNAGYRKETQFIENMKNVLEIEKKQAVKEFAEKIKNKVYSFLQAEMSNKKHFIAGDSEIDKLFENQNIGIIKAQDVLSKWFKVKIDELLKEYESGK